MSETRYVYVERPRGHGCFFGCLGVLLLVALPFIVAWGYGTWFLWQGFRESPAIRTAIEMAQHDGLAQRVLGRPITVTGVEGNSFSFATGVGARTNYVLHVEGPKGSGSLSVTAHTENGKARIDGMTLTGPGGDQYDLLHHAPAPSESGGTPI